MYGLEKKILVKGTVSAVTNNVAVNISKHQKPPHGYAVIDRRNVRVLETDGSDGAKIVDVRQHYIDVKADVTQVRLQRRALKWRLESLDSRQHINGLPSRVLLFFYKSIFRIKNT